MKLFITGATGQVGGALTKAAVAAGHSVVCLVRDPLRAQTLLGSGIEFVKGDLPLLGDWVGALGGCDRVVHVAGVVSYVGAKAGLMRAVNVEGTRVLLAAARAAGVRRFVFTSSIAALGEVPVGEVGDEETPWDWGRVVLRIWRRSEMRRRWCWGRVGSRRLCCVRGSFLGRGM